MVRGMPHQSPALLRLLLDFLHTLTRFARVISDADLSKLAWHIHSFRELAGCVVGFHGNGLCKTIGYPSCVTPNSELVAVVIEEVAVSKAPAVTAKATPEVAPPQVKEIVKNRSKIGAELVGAGVSWASRCFPPLAW